jgi:hypothetical protein
MEDVLATKVRALLELGEVPRAQEVATEALRIFPDSFELQQEVEREAGPDSW